MALEKKGSPIVVPAIRVADLPALPDDITDSTGMRKWWNDFRQVLARLIQSKSTTQTQIQQVQTTVTETEKQVAAESKPVEWDEIRNKPAKFPPADHEHETPWFQVEGPLVLSDVDPATNLATLGFYEQKAGYFLGGPVDGPEAKPVFRPLYAGDDRNFDGSGATDPGTPGTYDDLNGTTGGGTPEGIIAVQARGGAWTLVGFQEYTPTDGSGLSAPPKRYLREAWSGGNNCDPAVFAGARTVNPATGETTDSTTCNGMAVAYDMYGRPSCLYFANTYGSRVETLTRTVCTIAFSGGNEYCTNTGAWVRTLGNEDTADSAVQRLLATAVEWSSSATTAIRTVPTTGITGLYREARYRTEHTAGDPAVTSPTLIGLSPWQRYQLTITLESRPVDEAGTPTGDWAESGTRTHYILANLDGEGGIDWQVVEPTAGYETRIASTLVEVA